MASLKTQNEFNADADDFLAEFLHFVQQHKESTSLTTTGIPIILGVNDFSKKNEIESGNADPDDFALDMGIPPVDTLSDDEVSVVNNELGKTDFLQNNGNNLALDGLSEKRNIPIADSSVPFNHFLHKTKYASSNANLSFAVNNRIDNAISQRVSAELEKVLGDPCAFEDIELYLECSEDDIQSIQKNNTNQSNFASGSFSLHAGNSAIHNDVTLKISFPVVQNEIEGSKRCSSCKLSFLSQTDLLNHLNNSNCNVLICRECFYNTKSIKRFLTHMERRHSVSAVNFHDQTWKYKGTAVDSHTEESKRKLPCATNHTQNEHVNKKSALTFSCHLCQYTGKSSKLMKMHYHNLHDLNRGLYRCQSCQFTCLQKRTLDAHSKAHDNLFTHQCSECGKRFISNNALKRHSKIHRSKRDYACFICKKAFKIKSTLTDHVKRVHKMPTTEALPVQNQEHVSRSVYNSDQIIYNDKTIYCAYKVDVNGFGKVNDSFSRDIQDEKEIKDVVTADKESCNGNVKKTASKSSKLQPAQVVKTKNKRFSCTWPNCEKHFRDSYNLSNHYSRHTKVKNIRCSECQFTCIQKAHLNYHLKTKHSKNKSISK